MFEDTIFEGAVGPKLCIFIMFISRPMSPGLAFTKLGARRCFRHGVPRTYVYRYARATDFGASVNVDPWEPVPEVSAGIAFRERQ